MGEVLHTHVWEALKNRNLPFTRHRSFQKISRQRFSPTPYTTAELHTRDPQELGEFAITQATKLKVLLDSICEVEVYPRGDYKELLDLMEAYIGLNKGTIPVLGMFSCSQSPHGWGNSSIVTKWQCCK